MNNKIFDKSDCYKRILRLKQTKNASHSHKSKYVSYSKYEIVAIQLSYQQDLL